MFVNGSELETIAITDRGFTYGDGVFETILIHCQQAILLSAHLDRLAHGADRLNISLDRKLLESEIKQLSADFPEQGILKIIITRGIGGRGYRPAEFNEPTRVLSLHPLPDYGDDPAKSGIDAFVCKQRLSLQPALAGIKHLNRLEQVLASQEWPEGNFMEGIMLDMNDKIIEGTRSNIFWAEDGQLHTPSLAQCGVAGIMRNYLLNKMQGTQESKDCTLDRLLQADEIFICNSVLGVWPVRRIVTNDQFFSFATQQASNSFTLRCQDLFNKLLSNNAIE